MNKNNKFLLVMMMVMLTMFSITISAKEHADDKKLSCDGPYVVYQTDGSVRVISVTENGEVKDTVYAVLPKNFTLHVADHEGKYPFSVRLHPIARQPWKQSQARKTFVMSDPHGRLNLVVSLLKTNGVIDSQLRWAYGDNQLMVIGDIFDRGYDVPQIFWLFYKLEAEAAECGGRVSVLLGNPSLWSWLAICVTPSLNIRCLPTPWEFLIAISSVRIPSWADGLPHVMRCRSLAATCLSMQESVKSSMIVT